MRFDPGSGVFHGDLRERFPNTLRCRGTQQRTEACQQAREAAFGLLTFQLFVEAEARFQDLCAQRQSLARAVLELMGNIEGEPSPLDCAQAFCELILAVSDRDDADASDGEIDDDEATERWEKIEGRLREEYDRPQGGFARLMFGETKPESRRMIQLAFNRPHSFPRVLVAQSIVGREGLNLHKSCRIVVMLHPEWNPGVVEQQIGRVDRVDSHWCNELKKAIADGKQAGQLPCIEVRPVIFKGTYDEHNWQVLRARWDDLRAQLHGIVIPPSEAVVDQEHRWLIDEISEAAPNFPPTHTTNTLGQAAVRETETVRTPH